MLSRALMMGLDKETTPRGEPLGGESTVVRSIAARGGHLARMIVESLRRPPSSSDGRDRLAEALATLPRVEMIERRTAGISTIARLQGHSWGLYHHQFRDTIMLEPGRPFGLARELRFPPLAALVEAHQLGDQLIDIRAITRLSLSKGPLHAYDTLDDFALAECRSEIGQADLAALERCLRHYGIRLSTSPKAVGDRLEAVPWGGGDLYWPNGDGSHHFAAARYLAGTLGTPVSVHAPIVAHAISRAAVNDVHRQFSGWVVPNSGAIWEAARAMHECGASVGIAGMPHPYDALLLLFPRDERASMAAAHEVERAGAMPLRTLTDRWVSLQDQARERLPALFAIEA